jgi:hypothetical protein
LRCSSVPVGVGGLVLSDVLVVPVSLLLAFVSPHNHHDLRRAS